MRAKSINYYPECGITYAFLQGPHGAPVGPHGAPWGRTGPHGALWGPVGPHGAPWGPALWGVGKAREGRLCWFLSTAFAKDRQPVHSRPPASWFLPCRFR